jgi:hypothetical protein
MQALGLDWPLGTFANADRNCIHETLNAVGLPQAVTTVQARFGTSYAFRATVACLAQSADATY